jgi:hypothetical protein
VGAGEVAGLDDLEGRVERLIGVAGAGDPPDPSRLRRPVLQQAAQARLDGGAERTGRKQGTNSGPSSAEKVRSISPAERVPSASSRNRRKYSSVSIVWPAVVTR